MTAPKSIVIPLSSKWAVTGNEIISCLMRGAYGKEYEAGLKILEQCSGSLNVACGEGQTVREAIRSEYKTAPNVVNALEKVSGIAELKTRLVIH